MEIKECKFVCLGNNCPNHCCGTYGAISPNLQNLGTVSFTEIILLPEDVERLYKAGYEHLIIRKDDGIARINTAPDGTCKALFDGKCTIYDHRPAICRAYPLYLDMYAGVCALQECPGVSPNMTMDACRDALTSLLDIYQYWIDYYRKRVSA